MAVEVKRTATNWWRVPLYFVAGGALLYWVASVINPAFAASERIGLILVFAVACAGLACSEG
jgi:hypothetical protein